MSTEIMNLQVFIHTSNKAIGVVTDTTATASRTNFTVTILDVIGAERCCFTAICFKHFLAFKMVFQMNNL